MIPSLPFPTPGARRGHWYLATNNCFGRRFVVAGGFAKQFVLEAKIGSPLGGGFIVEATVGPFYACVHLFGHKDMALVFPGPRR